MHRFFIQLAYNGTEYHGWQIQPNARSVQEEIQKCLSLILREEIQVVGAGRTDTGVHAREMFAHFEFGKTPDLEQLAYRLNRMLGSTIAIQKIFKVGEEDHTRFSALSRTYEYWVVLHKDPFLTGLVYKLPKTPDFELMNEACALLFDYEDFSCFSKSGTQTKTNICKMMEAKWEQKGQVWVFTIQADRFLRNMVRAITGTLLEVGFHQITLEDFKNVIESKNRSRAGESVPAHALYLTAVSYPEHIEKQIER